jgi:hypothetical protein
MNFPITCPAKVFYSRSKPGRNLGATMLLLLVVSCEPEDIREFGDAPDFWEGNQTDFESGFSFQSKGNESVLHYRNSGRPYSGSIERNSSGVSTQQNFSSGKLNGLSSKRSQDGSWVEATYRDGLLQGEMTFYSADGAIRSVMKFEEGRLIPDSGDVGVGEANASSF